MNKKVLALFLFILLAGSAARGVEVLGGNYIFGFDQGESFLAVKKIVIDHKISLIGTQVGGKGGFFQGPGWYYLLSIPFFLFQGDPYGAMILMYILGVLTVVLSFFLTRKMFDSKTAIFVSLLITVSPAVIAQSRFIWAPFPISILSVIYLFCFYKVFQKKHIFLPILMFIVGLMYHFETATGITLSAATVIIFPFLILKKISSIKFIFYSICGFFVTFLPLIIFDLRHNFLNITGILDMFFLSKSGSDGNLGLYVFNHINIFRSNFLSTFYFGNNVFWPIILSLLAGSLFYLKKSRESVEKKLFVLYLLISPLLLFLVLLLYRSDMWMWWILELNIFYCFLSGILTGYFWQKNFLKIPITVVFIFLIFIFGYQTIDTYRKDLYDYGGTQKVKGKIDALDYIYKDSKGNKFGLLIFTPPVYTYAYDYLIWWYGKNKFKYIPYQDRRGIYYLLIETDPEKPWSYKGWLETVIKSGKIIDTKTLPSGFIVQKRFQE